MTNYFIHIYNIYLIVGTLHIPRVIVKNIFICDFWHSVQKLVHYILYVAIKNSLYKTKINKFTF